MPLRFGLIGCGRIVRRHHVESFRRHRDRVAISAVCDVETAAADTVATEFGATRTDDVPSLLARDDVDAVLIATPHDLHHADVLAAAAAGKHVLLEKPMAISLAQCEAMVAVCDRAGVTFMVAHNERYKANFRAIGRAVREGRIGDLLTVRADMHGNAPTPDLAGRWVLDGRRAGGGILMSLAIHRLDLVRSVAGDVADVTARCRTTSPLYVNGAEDTASVQVRFAGGAVLSLTAAATRHAPPGSSTMHFVGTRGTIAALLPRTGYDAPPSICGEATGGEWRELDLAPDVAALESDKMYQAELLHFETCVRTRSEPHTSGRENFATMRLVFALYESARRGGEVVRL